MKRELKHIFGLAISIFRSLIAEPIPMKRELKLLSILCHHHLNQRDCRAYPDEKGIETYKRRHGFLPNATRIAEPIPMKRGLKHSSEIDERVLDLYCRAYPDEKGIETLMIMVRNGHRTALQSLSR